ncbi:MAG: tRNA lysidine(34) synthetase TilS [Muribaculaceae bacterium]|nr:tRNA lysidine(34) synthetase TilS [Muribaculaceae bacterium]
MHLLERKISQNIQQHQLLDIEKPVIVALSGGADSVALLYILNLLGYNCIAAHCNFHLRGEESNRDEKYVNNIINQLGIEGEFTHFNVDEYAQEYHISTEMACRELRYEWFEKIRQKHNAQAIAVAHHRDDDIETMFLNLMRGSGIMGTAAMKWKNGNIVRPMLDISRNDIETYLSAQEIEYVVDSTNLENDFKRNKLRNKVIPAILQAFPDADSMLAKSLGYLKENREIYQYAIAQAQKQYQIGNTILLSKLITEYPAPKTLLHEILAPYGFNTHQVEDIINCAGGSGHIFYSSKFVIAINRETIELSEIKSFNRSNNEYEIDLSQSVVNPINLDVSFINPNEFAPTKSTNIAYFDAKILEGNPRFILRHWREGDHMAPFGLNGSKKLSDIFSNAKLSLIEKNNIWILEKDGVIIWIIGLRASRHFAVTQSTKKILVIKTI